MQIRKTGLDYALFLIDKMNFTSEENQKEVVENRSIKKMKIQLDEQSIN